MEQAIKFAFGTSRTERANEKERKGNTSSIMMKENVGASGRLDQEVAPTGAEEGQSDTHKNDEVEEGMEGEETGKCTSRQSLGAREVRSIVH
jgi:hypothetical protein